MRIGARSSVSVTAAHSGGTSPNKLRYAVASVKITDTLKLVEPPIAAIEVEVRAGRDPADLAREFEPSAQAIRSILD